jgi:tRNA A37 threonylcarbamoyladenosine biosynthesis protein TsaE
LTLYPQRQATKTLPKSMPAKIPVVLVTGFIGSDKTTLLRRIAENHPQWRMIFLVN